MSMLREVTSIPHGMLEADAPDLQALLGGPTLIHLPGRRDPALFVSILMHGNETSGWDAVRRLLARYGGGGDGADLPRSLSLFIGNVAAAAHGLRHLDGQPDFNRVWPGTQLERTPEHGLMESVVEIMRRRGVFASVDVHNNTGLNPHYACVNVIDNQFLHLATLFSRVVVYFLRPLGVQSMAMAQLCPAVTLECGKVGHRHGVEHVLDYLDACLRLAEHPVHPVPEHDIDLFHTVAVVKVPEHIGFGFGDDGADLQFADDVDRFNFRELPRGTLLGRYKGSGGVGLAACDEQGNDVADRYFVVEGGQLFTRVPVMPSMLTRDRDVIRQDCLCYLMERMWPEEYSV